MEKYFLGEKDVADDLGITMHEANLLIKNLNEIYEMDYHKEPFPRTVHKKYYEMAKEKEFMIRPMERDVPVERRLFWNLDEFVQMVPHAIGRSYAKKFLKDIGLLSTNGDKKIVNRIAFEEWCANNPRVDVKEAGICQKKERTTKEEI